MVEGVNLTQMSAECTARAAARTDRATADTRGILVDFMSIYPFGELKAVVDFQQMRTCGPSY